MKHSVCILVLLVIAATVLMAGGAPRLVVDNRTNSAVSVQVWRYNGVHWDWTQVSVVDPRHWTALYDIREGDRFRAVASGGQERSHVVKFYVDRAYGGQQDIWLIQ